MIRRLLLTVLAAALAVGSFAQDSSQARPRIELETTQVPGVSVHFLTIPWGPQTFAAMQAPGDGYYNQRNWPFARLETQVRLKLADHDVAPGNYALVFHPNNQKDEGMALEMLKIAPGEFLKPGSVYTPTPAGERLFIEPVRFDTAKGVSPTLKVQLSPSAGKLSLIVQYGDKQLIRTLEK